MMKENSPYEEYENSQLWNVIKKSLDDLVDNQDIVITTKKDYVIGYICKKISEDLS